MTKDSEEYKAFKAEYEAKEQEKQDHPEKYPYWAYFQFGFHRMTYMTEAEVQDAVKFYKLKPDYKGGWFRFGRQPITIIPRKENHEHKSNSKDADGMPERIPGRG